MTMETLRTMAPKEGIQHGSQKFPLECYINEYSEVFPIHYHQHWHDEVELISVEKGPFTVTIHSKQVVLDSSCFYLVPSKAVHGLIQGAKSVQRYLVFNPSMLRLSFYDKLLGAILDNLYDTNLNIIPVRNNDTDDYKECKECFDYIFKNYKEKDDSIRLLIKAKLIVILTNLYRQGIFNQVEISSSFEKERTQKLKDLIIWIQDHHSGPLSIEDAAAKMDFSQEYFCRFFKKATGMSFTEYVNDYRLEQASGDIERGEKSISDVAADHGFDNDSYFFRLFKKKYGTTPLKYRKRKS